MLVGRLVRRQRDAWAWANDLADERATAPEAEFVAVGVHEIREGLKSLPLLLVVTISKPARVIALAARRYLEQNLPERLKR